MASVSGSNNIVDNSTVQWVKIGKISLDADQKVHQAALTFLSDLYVLDTPARLLNLQLGFGESKTGATHNESPFEQKATKDELLIDFRKLPHPILHP
jgi:acyl-CoA thioesterase